MLCCALLMMAVIYYNDLSHTLISIIIEFLHCNQKDKNVVKNPVCISFCLFQIYTN